MTDPEVRVLIADDSRTARALLAGILGADPGIEVVGEATDGAEALKLTTRLCPSLVVMDIEMPVMDGFEATKRIMMANPTPIMIVSARDDAHQVEVGLQAVRAGALTVFPKPGAPGTPEFVAQSRRLVTLVKALADVSVVRQHSRRSARAVAEPERLAPRRALEVVGVAASTGGPAALYRFLEVLPRTLGVPVLVVQHIADGFVDGLARWLATATVLPVCVAADGMDLAPGQVYLAPDDRHLEVAGGRVSLSSAVPDGGFRPSANMLFASLAAAFGPAAAGVVLTGMGNDGLRGAMALCDAGGLVLAQDAGTSVVFGMPRAVADAGVAAAVGTVEDLAATIVRFAQKRGA